MEIVAKAVTAAPTSQQRYLMTVTERTVSVFSVLGIAFIILTYMLSSHFRRPINRLVFFTSFGNLGMNIAALIAENGPAAGAGSPLCKFQGFLVQMFLGVDAYWSLCMALNVYLIFFGHFNTQQLRRLDIRYLFCCYGLALIPSIVFLGVNTDKGPIYGDAVLWCWIQESWAVLRIGLVYSISWIAISLALVVYCMAAVNVYKRREELQPGFMNPLNDAPLKSMVTTEISIRVESAIVDESGRLGYSSNGGFGKGTVETSEYQVAINASPSSNNPAAGFRTLTRNAATYHSNTEALLYARAAFFYFIALLIIWVPASANRAWAVAHSSSVYFPLNYLSCLLLSGQGFLNAIVYMITSREPMGHLIRTCLRHPRHQKPWPLEDEEELNSVRRVYEPA